MTRPDDDDLRARFATLRRAELGAAPPLDALLVRPRVRRRLATRAALAAAAVLLVALLGIRLAARRTEDVRRPPPSIVAWRSPTASLLRTPGEELLRTVPTLRSSLLRAAPLDSLVTHGPGA
ncbi:hypothetical protein J421_1408 [Gemmatirosa kalamazoonensis]|uniref:Uncharacterized protein n=1 Tax=Gemmatirosa kalamazoonensis TaxID=861299 RepID=W0RF31_9BACT|nr:hypothetical protein [Gemmatirosa kalamazoonensis]AHG88945.1 hypothetical protein J421_1408 [Gemmatirosa kalamazoonensis]